METTIQVKIEINGKEEILSYAEAEKLYKELEKIFYHTYIPPITIPWTCPIDLEPKKWPGDNTVTVYGVRTP